MIMQMLFIFLFVEKIFEMHPTQNVLRYHPNATPSTKKRLVEYRVYKIHQEKEEKKWNKGFSSK